MRVDLVRFVGILVALGGLFLSSTASASVSTCSDHAPSMGLIGGMLGVASSTLIVPVVMNLQDDERNQYRYLPNLGWTFLASTGAAAVGVLGVTATGCNGLDDLGFAYAFGTPLLLSLVTASVVQVFLWEEEETKLTLSPSWNMDAKIDGVVGGVSFVF